MTDEQEETNNCPRCGHDTEERMEQRPTAMTGKLRPMKTERCTNPNCSWHHDLWQTIFCKKGVVETNKQGILLLYFVKPIYLFVKRG